MQIAEQEWEEIYKLHMNKNSMGNENTRGRKILGVIGCHSACENVMLISCGHEKREINFPVSLFSFVIEHQAGFMCHWAPIFSTLVHTFS